MSTPLPMLQGMFGGWRGAGKSAARQAGSLPANHSCGCPHALHAPTCLLRKMLRAKLKSELTVTTKVVCSQAGRQVGRADGACAAQAAWHTVGLHGR
jgi:hypothetical protein